MLRRNEGATAMSREGGMAEKKEEARKLTVQRKDMGSRPILLEQLLAKIKENEEEKNHKRIVRILDLVEGAEKWDL